MTASDLVLATQEPGNVTGRITKKLVLILVDGMTPAAFERAVESARAPALGVLAEHGTYRHATSVFPSLTPVCLSSIVTGARRGATRRGAGSGARRLVAPRR